MSMQENRSLRYARYWTNCIGSVSGLECGDSPNERHNNRLQPTVLQVLQSAAAEAERWAADDEQRSRI